MCKIIPTVALFAPLAACSVNPASMLRNDVICPQVAPAASCSVDYRQAPSHNERQLISNSYTSQLTLEKCQSEVRAFRQAMADCQAIINK